MPPSVSGRPAFSEVVMITPKEETRPLRVHSEVAARDSTTGDWTTYADGAASDSPLRFRCSE